MAIKGSRYIQGHLGYADYARLEEGQEAFIVLNPAEPEAHGKFKTKKAAQEYLERLLST